MQARSRRTLLAAAALGALAALLASVRLLELEYTRDMPLLLPASALLVFAAAMTLAHLRSTHRAYGRMRRRLVERSHELARLHGFGRDLSATTDSGEIARLSERAAADLLEADGVCLALGRHSPDPRLPAAAASIAARVLEEQRAYRVSDPEAFCDGPRSRMAVPMWIDREVSGVITVWSDRPSAFDDHGMELLCTVAQQAAVALERARHLVAASTDALTGLSQREVFFERVHVELERARRYGSDFALLMLDIDHFKTINDTYGHLAGDAFLVETGRRVTERLRAADLACRFGGDELTLLLPETDIHGARRFAERLRRDLAELSVPVDDAVIRSTVSIGVAAFGTSGARDLSELLGAADEALYRAKRRGRNRVAAHRGSPPRAQQETGDRPSMRAPRTGTMSGN